MPRPALQPGDPVRIADPKLGSNEIRTVKTITNEMVEVTLDGGMSATFPREGIRVLDSNELVHWLHQTGLTASYADRALKKMKRRDEGEDLPPVDSVRNTSAILGEPRLLEMERIDSSPLNPRKSFGEKELQSLAGSMQADGQLQPIVVRPVGDRFVIVAGERRWRAAQRLQWTHIATVIRDDVDQAAHLRFALLENLERSDLTVFEEADGYRQLQELGMTQAAIAKAVHRSQPAVANTTRLLKLPEDVRAQIEGGVLTPSHGLALLRFEATPKVLSALAEIAVGSINKGQPVRSRDLEHGLPWEWELESRRAIKRLPYFENPHEKACAACPLNARVDRACLRPDHWNQLEAERHKREKEEAERIAQRAREASEKTQAAAAALEAFRTWSAAVPTETLIEAWEGRERKGARLADSASREVVRLELFGRAQRDPDVRNRIDAVAPEIAKSPPEPEPADNGKAKKTRAAKSADSTVRLPQFDYSRHVELGTYQGRPTDCTDACPCFAPQMRYRDKIVAACTDRHRFQGLEAADTRRKNKVNRARYAELIEELGRQVDSLTSFDEARTWALLFHAIAQPEGYGWRSHLRAAAERQDVVLRNYGEGRDHGDGPYELTNPSIGRIAAERPPLEMAKLVIEAIVRADLEPMSANGAPSTRSRRAVTWLGLDEIQVGDFVSVPADPVMARIEYRVEGYVVDRASIASVIGKERAKKTARMVRLSYAPDPPGVTTKVMIGGRCTTLVEFDSMVKVRSGQLEPAEEELDSDLGEDFVEDVDEESADAAEAEQEALAVLVGAIP